MLEVGYKVSNSVFPQFPINIGFEDPLTVNFSVVEQTPDDFFEITYRPIPLSLEGEDLLPPQITVSLEPEKPVMVVSGLNPLYVNVGDRGKNGKDPINFSLEDGLLDRLAEISFNGEPVNTTGTPEPVELSFSVSNPATESWMTERTETIRASVPFPSGEYLVSDLNNLAVSGKQTCWLPLQYWGDNSVKIAQAQITDTIEYETSSSYTIASSTGIAYQGAFTKHPWIGNDLQVGAMVTDNANKRYVAFATGAGEIVQSTGMVQTKRYRTYHQPIDTPNIGRDFLTSMYYITQFKDMPFTVVDWIVGNDYSGVDDPGASTDPNDFPLGSVDVNSAYFLVSATELNTGVAGRNEIEPYFKDRNNIGDPETLADYSEHKAYQVMDSTYLGDAQTRRYRFIVKHLPENPTNNQTYPTQRTFRSMLRYPMFALASFDSWKQTDAAGLIGGPIAGGVDSLDRAKTELSNWQNTNHFGTWGSFGHTKDTTTGGAPINQALTEPFAHAIQSGYHSLLQKLEGMAWQQAARPFHLYGLEVSHTDSVYLWRGLPFARESAPQYRTSDRELLGRRPFLRYNSVGNTAGPTDPYYSYRLRFYDMAHGSIPPENTSEDVYRSLHGDGDHKAHGFMGYDWEHLTVDLLFEYYMVTGDPWAHEELKNMGYSTISLYKTDPDYYSGKAIHTRAEGLGVQTLTNCYQATQIGAFKDHALRRVKECVIAGLPQTILNHPGNFIVDRGVYTAMYGPFLNGWPGDYGFFIPWHHAYVFFGYLGAYLHFGDQEFLDVCDDTVEMVQYSWVSGVTDVNVGYIEDGLRYYVPSTSAFNSGNYTTNDIVPANYYDNVPISYPGFSEVTSVPPGQVSLQIAADIGGALNSAVIYLRAGLLKHADITTDSNIAAIADDLGEILLRGGRGLAFPESERHDKWVYNIPHDIT